MCGICGIVHGDSEAVADRGVLERMNAAIVHRGPDDEGLWLRKNAGLAARRLSIIDVEHGHQPMISEDGALVLVFNGEIYNAHEIRTDLEARGARFKTRCDTEVVLNAWSACGEDALARFNGMFAFAIYDTTRNRLTLARDRLGIKPVFYTVRNGTLAFASELDALLRANTVSGRLNPDAIDAFFAYLYIPGEISIFEDVRKLAPGELAVFEKGTLTRSTYWRPEFSIDNSWTLNAAAERFRELLTDSVRLRTASDVPLGAFLSGGMDSSAIVALLAEASSAPVKTFTIGLDDAHADERRYARAVAKKFGTDHTELVAKPDIVNLLPDLIRHFGEPFADSSAVLTWLVSKLARDQVTVALSGDGGDELFAGYTWTRMNRSVAQYRRVPKVFRKGIDGALAWLPPGPSVEKIRRFSRDSFLDFRDSFFRRQTCFAPPARHALYRPEFRAEVGEAPPGAFGGPFSASDNDWMLAADMNTYLPDDILTKVDRMSMAVSLEARVPMLDHRLVEFACTVPFPLKLARGTSKRLVKHALKDLLPPECLAQRKQGFSLPIHRWLREDLHDYFEDTVLSANARCADWLDMRAVRDLFSAHAERRENYGHHLWALLVFEQWLGYASSVSGMAVEPPSAGTHSRV